MDTDTEETKNEINKLSALIEDISKKKTVEDGKSKNRMKSLRDSYVALQIDATPEIHDISVKSKSSRTEEEKEELKNWLKKTKAEFNGMVKLLFPVGDNANSVDAIVNAYNRAEKTTRNIQLALSFLAYKKDFVQLEEIRGRGIGSNVFEMSNVFSDEYYDDDSVKGNLLDIFKGAENDSIGNTQVELDISNAFSEFYGESEHGVVSMDNGEAGITESQFKKMINIKSKTDAASNEVVNDEIFNKNNDIRNSRIMISLMQNMVKENNTND